MAVWREEIRRHLQRLQEIRERLFVGQLAGGGGTLASLHPEGIELQEAFCRELGLCAPPITWHTARDSLSEFVQIQALITSTLGKIANEVLILQHTEIDELAESFEDGRGASSTMPQKANPILSEYILAISKIVRQEAILALEGMAQDHERGTGQWQVEWKAIPEVCVLTHGALSKSIRLLENLEVKPSNMERNLASSEGLIIAEALMMALARKLGRQRSHDIVYQACVRSRQDDIDLVEALLEHPEVGSHFSREQLGKLTEPRNYLGYCEYFALGKGTRPQR
jgi:3-carboxy-cis,cis-muconate cycloisomerase